MRLSPKCLSSVLGVPDDKSLERMTDKFQERLLKQAGIGPGRRTATQLQLEGWRGAVQQLANQHPIMILERERGPAPEFFIGTPLEIAASHVEFRHFSGTGKWSTKTARLKYSQITCLQVGTRYADFYHHYFSTKRPKTPPKR